MSRMKAMIAGLVAGVVVVAGVPSAALAGESGPIPALNEGIGTAVAAVVVFFVCAVVLGVFVWPKISQALVEREEKIKSEIEAAEQARAQASVALEQYQRSLAEARAEAQKMIDAAKAQMGVQLTEMKLRGEAEAAALKAKTMTEIEAAKKQAISDIYSYSSTLATQVAGKILRREVGQVDNQRLMDEALAGLGQR
jgi:F-type H+-transporting ATPase subunit b